MSTEQSPDERLAEATLDPGERRLLEAVIVARQREIATLHRISELGLRAQPLEQILPAVVEEVSACTSFPIVAIEFYDAARQVMTFAAATGMPLPPDPSSLCIPVEQTLSGLVACSGQAVTETRAQNRPEYAAAVLRQLGVQTFVCVPMGVAGQVIGTLALAHPEAAPTDAPLLTLAHSLANVIAILVARKRAEERSLATERQLREILDRLVAGVMLLDAEGRYLFANERAAGHVGLTSAELVGKTLVDVFPPDLAQHYLERNRRFIAARDFAEYEACLELPAGTRTFFIADQVLTDAQGQGYALLSSSIDITARTQAEAALHQLNETLELRVVARTEELRRANAALAQAARLKDEFLATMSHELRTPLNAILGRAELLREGIYGPPTPQQIDALRSVESNGQHLLTLIGEILDLAKSEAGKLQIELAPVPVVDVCARSLQMVSARAHQKQIALSSRYDSQVTTILVDVRRLIQILVNLLANAVKFTPTGGAVGLEVTGDSAQQTLTFTVWDTGIGIAEADLPRLFQPFTQLDSGLDRRYEGTGLGLALVQRLVEAHQGHVTVTSGPGEGSRFSVTLPWTSMPARLPSGAPEMPSAHDPLRPAEADLNASSGPLTGVSRPAILLVEEHVAQAQAIAAYLEARGYALSLAQNGGDALILARETPPALVLIDIQLPGMDGLTTIRCMRAAPPLRSVPILALTALDRAGDRERCLEAGADAYLVKPVSLHTLLRVIETNLDRRAEPGMARTTPEAD